MVTTGKQPCVYMLSNRRNGTLYIGVTSDLVKRVWQHKNDLAEGFSKKFKTHNLVWYELHDTMESAISREKTIKKWNRTWKLQLIEKKTPLGTIFMTNCNYNSKVETWIPAFAGMTRPSFPNVSIGNPDGHHFVKCRLKAWIPAFAGMTTI